MPDYIRASAKSELDGSDIFQPRRPMLAIFLITVSLNAALLFIIEPMIARMILPFAGGSPEVWNTSVLFFQLTLLLGYLYAHFAGAWLGKGRHGLVHLLLLVAGILFLPVAIPADWFTPQRANPTITILIALFCSIGLPFFVLSASAPLLQEWFSKTNEPVARDPYFIYAASNFGSMLGLLAYLLFFERWLLLTQQASFWLFGYLALVCGTAGCILLSVRLSGQTENRPGGVAVNTREGSTAIGIPFREITLARRLRWLCWSFVPSSLLLGVTTHITTDIASAPLFWVLPLALYLLAYVVAFAHGRWATHAFLVRRQAFLLLAAALTVLLQATTPVMIILPLHLLAFFATALLCDGQLAQDRPEPAHLTEFYLWIAFGGMLGGLFNTILAPMLFRSVLEYPLAMTAAAFLRPYVPGANRRRWDRSLDLLLPIGLLVTAVSLMRLTEGAALPQLNARLFSFAIPGMICLSFAYRPLRFGLGLSALLLASLIAHHPLGKTLYQARSFFGVYRVIDQGDTPRHVLFHGTTAHGAQNLNSRLEPISYYHRTGPAGQLLRVAAQIQPRANIAIVGLGTGALACHGAPTQKFTFFEIDPLVERIARDDRLFTYLRDCPPEVSVVIGDARLSLAKVPDSYYDFLILDAFSSDVIPTHLVTLEAIKLYLAKTTPDGIILIHISNRYMDLVPIFDRLAQTLNLAAYLRNDFEITPEEENEGKVTSRWIVLSRSRESLGKFVDHNWITVRGQFNGDLWTDDFTDILRVIRWHE